METGAITPVRPAVLIFKFGLPVVLFAAIILAPTPEGLTPQGQRALAVMGLAVALWASEALPIAVTGLVGVVLLILVGAVPGAEAALYGFSQPVAYFIIGILTLGLAVERSGLAERMAVHLMRLAGGSPRMLYVQMLVSFAALTFALPSASTRGAIMVHVYEQVMDHWAIPRQSPLNKAVMMAFGALNRLGSTALLAGGITPVVASALIGDFSWTGWFILMAVPFYSVLVAGGVMVYFYYRAGFKLSESMTAGPLTTGPMSTREIKAGIIAVGTALLWFTDFAHGLHPTVPALIALVVILLPGVGLLTWREFETNIGWSNFFVIATSLSLAQAQIASGAAEWFAQILVGGVEAFKDSPYLLLLALAGGATAVRLMMPNITGFLAFTIPVAMSTGASLGLNPLVCGLAVVLVGDSVVYYPAGSASSVFVFQRAEITAPEVFRIGVLMTLVAIGVLFAVAVPYWGLVGEPLVP